MLFAYSELNKTEIEERRSDDPEANGSSNKKAWNVRCSLLYRVNEHHGIPWASPVHVHDDRRGPLAKSFNRRHMSLVHRKARSMGYARVLKDKVSIRVVELLIIGSVESITVLADGKYFRQHEAYARRSRGNPTRGPSYMVELDGSVCRLFPSPLTLAE